VRLPPYAQTVPLHCIDCNRSPRASLWSRVPRNGVVTIACLSLAHATPKNFETRFELERLGPEIAPVRTLVLRPDQAPAAQIATDGRLMVLDAQSERINVYSAAGSYLFNLPTAGARQRKIIPRAFALGSHGLVGVIELYGHALSLFRLRTDTAVFLRRINFPTAPNSVCALGRDLFVDLTESDGAVFRIRDDTQVSIAFTAPYDKTIPEMQRYLHDRSLSCIEFANMILAVSPMFPVITAFSETGQLKWRQILAEFRQISISQISKTQMLVSVPKTGYQTFSTGFPVNGSIVALQLRHVSRADVNPLPNPSIETRFLSLSTGQEISRTSQIPEVIAANSKVMYGYDPSTGGFQPFRFRLR
jgi:hypothetical protein